MSFKQQSELFSKPFYSKNVKLHIDNDDYGEAFKELENIYIDIHIRNLEFMSDLIKMFYYSKGKNMIKSLKYLINDVEKEIMSIISLINYIKEVETANTNQVKDKNDLRILIFGFAHLYDIKVKLYENNLNFYTKTIQI